MTSVPSSRKRFPIIDLLTYLLATVCLIALVVIAGRGALERLAALRWLYLAGAFVVTYLFIESMALRYASILRFLHAAKAPSHLPILYGTVFGMTAGLIFTRGVGQLLAKPAVLKDQQGLPMSQGVYASFLERLMDLATGIVLSCAFLLKIALGSEPFTGFFLLIFLGSLVAWTLGAIPCLSRMLRGIFDFLKGFVDLLATLRWIPTERFQQWLDQSSGEVLSRSKGRIGGAGFVLWTLAKVVLMSGRLFLLSQAFPAHIGWEYFLIGVPVVQLGLLLAFTPGSLGFLDAAWFAVLSLQGVPSEAILTLLLSLRVTNYVFFPLMTLIVWGVYRSSLSGRFLHV